MPNYSEQPWGRNNRSGKNWQNEWSARNDRTLTDWQNQLGQLQAFRDHPWGVNENPNRTGQIDQQISSVRSQYDARRNLLETPSPEFYARHDLPQPNSPPPPPPQDPNFLANQQAFQQQKLATPQPQQQQPGGSIPPGSTGTVYMPQGGGQQQPPTSQVPLPGQDGRLPGGGAPGGKYPEHWGRPPLIQTMDVRKLPGDYGMGSSTEHGWIQQNMERDQPPTSQVPLPGQDGRLPGGGAPGGGQQQQQYMDIRNPDERMRQQQPGNDETRDGYLDQGRPQPWAMPGYDDRVPGGQPGGHFPGGQPGGGQQQNFPVHWGPRPGHEDRGPQVELPGGYGMGQGTLAGWIQRNMDRDAQGEQPGVPLPGEDGRLPDGGAPGGGQPESGTNQHGIPDHIWNELPEYIKKMLGRDDVNVQGEHQQPGEDGETDGGQPTWQEHQGYPQQTWPPEEGQREDQDAWRKKYAGEMGGPPPKESAGEGRKWYLAAGGFTSPGKGIWRSMTPEQARRHNEGGKYVSDFQYVYEGGIYSPSGQPQPQPPPKPPWEGPDPTEPYPEGPEQGGQPGDWDPSQPGRPPGFPGGPPEIVDDARPYQGSGIPTGHGQQGGPAGDQPGPGGLPRGKHWLQGGSPPKAPPDWLEDDRVAYDQHWQDAIEWDKAFNESGIEKRYEMRPERHTHIMAHPGRPDPMVRTHVGYRTKDGETHTIKEMPWERYGLKKVPAFDWTAAHRRSVMRKGYRPGGRPPNLDTSGRPSFRSRSEANTVPLPGQGGRLPGGGAPGGQPGGGPLPGQPGGPPDPHSGLTYEQMNDPRNDQTRGRGRSPRETRFNR